MIPMVGLVCIEPVLVDTSMDLQENEATFGLTKRYIHSLFLCPSISLSNLDNCAAVATKITFFLAPIIVLITGLIDLFLAFSGCLNGEVQEDEEACDGLGSTENKVSIGKEESFSTPKHIPATDISSGINTYEDRGEIKAAKVRFTPETPIKARTDSIFFSPLEEENSVEKRTQTTAQPLIVPCHRRARTPAFQSNSSQTPSRLILSTPPPSDTAGDESNPVTPAYSSALRFASFSHAGRINEEAASDEEADLVPNFAQADSNETSAGLPKVSVLPRLPTA